MRVRGALYGLLIVLAAILGIVAAGLPARGGSDRARISDPPPTPTTIARTTTTVAPAPSTTTTTTAVSAHTPAQVTVLVANGTPTTGAATKLTKSIGRGGYKTLTAVDANNRSTTTTAVYYAAGYQRDADTLAAVIGAPASAVQAMPLPLPVSSLQSANVLVVLGSDLAH
jgi:hypothetical protein